MTFHSLGLEIIGGATGKKPNVPKWATKTELGLEKLGEIVDSLKDRSDEFRTRWDMFRLVFGQDHSDAVLRDVADAFDRDGEARLITLNGEHVASQQERLIANWLFYNGVEYLYERPYEHDTATAERRQYVPDFYYPQLNLYHEHFAFDGDGQAPEHFKGYADDAAWKRDTHAAYGTHTLGTPSSPPECVCIFARHPGARLSHSKCLMTSTWHAPMAFQWLSSPRADSSVTPLRILPKT